MRATVVADGQRRTLWTVALWPGQMHDTTAAACSWGGGRTNVPGERNVYGLTTSVRPSLVPVNEMITNVPRENSS